MNTETSTARHRLSTLLREYDRDLRALKMAGFRCWLKEHLERWQRNTGFQLRAEIRDILRDHPDLGALQEAKQRAAREDARSEQFSQLERLIRERHNTELAIAGLRRTLSEASVGRVEPLQIKLRAFERKAVDLENSYRQLLDQSPARQNLLVCEQRVDQRRKELGVDQLEARLAQELSSSGRQSGSSGRSFEAQAITIIRRYLHNLQQIDAFQNGPLEILTGVTLGATKIEFDQLIVRPLSEAGALDVKRARDVERVNLAKRVEVVAVVEVKRNINDLAKGFRQRQENLAWLTGLQSGYDPEEYRNRQYPTGHFDRATEWHHEGQVYRLDQSAFSRFQPDPATGYFLDGLYFVTRPGTLWGLSSAALSRIQHRVATDRHWQQESVAYIAELLQWCKQLAHPVETPEVLKLYASQEHWARQIFLM